MRASNMMTLSSLPNFRNENSEAERGWDGTALPAMRGRAAAARNVGEAQPTHWTPPDS